MNHEEVFWVGGTQFKDYEDFLKHGRYGPRGYSPIFTAGGTGLSGSVNNYVLEAAGGEYTVNFNRSLELKLRDHENKIIGLLKQIDILQVELLERDVESKEKDEKIEEIQRVNEQLSEKIKLSHLISRVSLSAQSKLLDNPEFRDRFDQQTACPAYVIAIDIRRSTELMLKAMEKTLKWLFLIGKSLHLQTILHNSKW